MGKKGGTPENLKPWQPGQSGNPAGRPEGARSLSTLLREMLEEKIDVQIEGQGATKKQFKEVLLRRLLKAANEGDIRAINTIFDRVDGKAQQFIELTPGAGAADLGFKHEVIFRDFTKPQPKKKPTRK